MTDRKHESEEPRGEELLTVNIEALLGMAVTRNPGKLAYRIVAFATEETAVEAAYDPCGHPSFAELHCKSASLGTFALTHNDNYETAHHRMWTAIIEPRLPERESLDECQPR